MTTPELRCDHKKHAELHGRVLEIKCRQAFCGAGPGSVVIHRWDVTTGERLEDKRYRDPFPVRKKEQAA